MARRLIRLAPHGGEVLLYEWDREGVEALGPPELPVTARRIFDRAEPLVFASRAEADDEVRSYMELVGAEALVAYPAVWQDRVVAAVGFHELTPRPWADVEPLLRRLAPQIAAALAQAEAYREVRELARTREELVTNVSHELRTPLTATLGFLRTLERTDVELEPRTRRELLAVARGEAERLALLVEDLLQLARASGAPALEKRPVRLREVVERAVRGIEPVPGRMIRNQISADIGLGADPDRLLQVFTNLVSNAFAHGEGAVEVSAGRADGSVVVRVSDEGPPIPQEDVEELFLPFARRSESAPGTGLGLSIARALVEAHGGTLTYDGAFVVRLPL